MHEFAYNSPSVQEPIREPAKNVSEYILQELYVVHIYMFKYVHVLQGWMVCVCLEMRKYCDNKVADTVLIPWTCGPFLSR